MPTMWIHSHNLLGTRKKFLFCFEERSRKVVVKKTQDDVLERRSYMSPKQTGSTTMGDNCAGPTRVHDNSKRGKDLPRTIEP